VGEHDWKLLAAGFGIMVGPFLAFTLWTLVPLPASRVAEWFAAFGRLHRSGVPLVRARLVRVRWHRRLGALVGAVGAWGVASWQAIVHNDDGPSWLWVLPLVGYVGGAVLAEVRGLQPGDGATRVAELTPRRVSDFVAPWALRALATVSVTSALASLGTAHWAGEGVAEALAPPAAAIVGLAVALWCARSVAEAPLRVEPGRDPYLDDAFRQVAITTCLAAGGIAAALVLGDAVADVLPETGWWPLIGLVCTWAVVLPCWVALRQPVPWTFGPRLRAAWGSPAEPSPVAS